MSEKLTEKLQVLLTSEEVSQINWVILQDALQSNNKPQPVSAFIRQVIKEALKKKKIVRAIRNLDQRQKFLVTSTINQ